MQQGIGWASCGVWGRALGHASRPPVEVTAPHRHASRTQVADTAPHRRPEVRKQHDLDGIAEPDHAGEAEKQHVPPPETCEQVCSYQAVLIAEVGKYVGQRPRSSPPPVREAT